MATAPRFQVEVIRNRKVSHTAYSRNPDKKEDGINFLTETVTRIIPESYMVYFPSGHSVWFETKADMAQAGLTENANFEVDLDTGLPVTPPKQIDLKQLVESKTTRRRSQMTLEV